MSGAGRGGVWAETSFVERWMAGDSMGSVIALPQRISAALVADDGLQVRRVVDIGSGPGSYLRVFLEEFPDAEGVWVDASEAMLERGRAALADLAPRVEFVIADLRDAGSLPLEADVVVSSRAVHHFTSATIQAFYLAAARSLTPGGFLCNLDHFEAPGAWKAAYRRVKPRFTESKGGGASHDHDAPPSLIDEHRSWLEAAGFESPDVPWRYFWTALIVARTASG